MTYFIAQGKKFLLRTAERICFGHEPIPRGALKYLLALVLLSVAPKVVIAQSDSALPVAADIGNRWTYVGESDFSKFYLDTSRISPVDAARADLWVHQILHIRSAQYGDWLDRSVDHVRVNCETPTIEGIFSTTWYDEGKFVKTMGDGTLHQLPASTNSTETAAALCKAIARTRAK